MAVVTGVVAGYVIQRFSGGRYPVMTGEAGAGYNSGMIKRCRRRPSNCGVTIITGVAAWDVVWRLTGCRDPVVTGDTCSRYDTGMIECSGRTPRYCRVTIVAGVAALDVIGRLTARGDAVMAHKTGAEDGSVIDPEYGAPGNRAVAILTQVCCLNVCYRLAGRR